MTGVRDQGLGINKPGEILFDALRAEHIAEVAAQTLHGRNNPTGLLGEIFHYGASGELLTINPGNLLIRGDHHHNSVAAKATKFHFPASQTEGRRDKFSFQEVSRCRW